MKGKTLTIENPSSKLLEFVRTLIENQEEIFLKVKEVNLKLLFDLLDLLDLWWDSSFGYYNERSDKLNIYFLCRQNKHTKKKYFRTMRPIAGGIGWSYDDNEWIEYNGKIDNIINTNKWHKKIKQ